MASGSLIRLSLSRGPMDFGGTMDCDYPLGRGALGPGERMGSGDLGDPIGLRRHCRVDPVSL